MTALSEALVQAQRRAIGALEKAYLADRIDWPQFSDRLKGMGCTYDVDQVHLSDALDTLKTWGASLPAATGESPKDAPPTLEPDWFAIAQELCHEPFEALDER